MLRTNAGRLWDIEKQELGNVCIDYTVLMRHASINVCCRKGGTPTQHVLQGLGADELAPRPFLVQVLVVASPNFLSEFTVVASVVAVDSGGNRKHLVAFGQLRLRAIAVGRDMLLGYPMCGGWHVYAA